MLTILIIFLVIFLYLSNKNIDTYKNSLTNAQERSIKNYIENSVNDLNKNIPFSKEHTNFNIYDTINYKKALLSNFELHNKEKELLNELIKPTYNPDEYLNSLIDEGE